MKKRIITIALCGILIITIALCVGIFNNRTNVISKSKVSKIEASSSGTYTIYFDVGDGNIGPSDMTSDGGNILIPSMIPQRSGYAFIQWKVRGTNVTVQPGQTFYNVKDYANSSKDVFFEAQWGYLVKFDTNGGSWGPSDMILEGGDITIPSDVPVKSGSAFIQWKVKGTNIAGRPGQTFYNVQDYLDNQGVLTFVAEWGYTIKFDANGGVGEPSEMVSDGGNVTIPSEEPERAGYSFIQWKVKGTNTAGRPNQTFYNIQDYVDDSGVLTFVAEWGYTITYNANGGFDAPSSEVKVEGGTIYLSGEIPQRAGYNFLGWSTNSNATTPTYQAGAAFSENGNITLYAVWEKEKEVYTISYDANGGINKPENQTRQEGTIINLSDVIPSRDGYKFLGWSTNSNAMTPTYQAGAAFSEDGNITLYAIWEKEKEVYTVSYDANGGINKPENQTRQEGTIINLSDVVPSRNGYKFLGWSTNSNATTPTYQAGAAFSEDGNITLYAVWKKEKNESDNTTDSDITNSIVNNTVTNTVNNTTSNEISNIIKNDTVTNIIKNDIEDNNNIEDDDTDENTIDDNTIDDNTIDDNTIDKNSIISGKDEEMKNKVEKNAVGANNPDNTKAKTVLPKAGMNTLRSVIVLVVIISLIFGFKYKSTKLS